MDDRTFAPKHNRDQEQITKLELRKLTLISFEAVNSWAWSQRNTVADRGQSNLR